MHDYNSKLQARGASGEDLNAARGPSLIT